MAKIGFIGTGIMGKPMAQNLQKAGHSLFLSTHHDAAPADLLEAGAIALANPEGSGPGSRVHHRHGAGHPAGRGMCCSARTVSPKASARTRW